MSNETSGVGVFGCMVATYCTILLFMQFGISSETSKMIISLSSASLTLMALSSVAIVFTYYSPRMSGSCMCYSLWSLSLVSYVVSLYLIKAMYIVRIYIVSFADNSNLGSKAQKKAIKAITSSLTISCFIALFLVIFMTDGECHSDVDAYGCITDWHASEVYASTFMIFLDCFLFLGFCYKWYELLSMFRGSGSENEIPAALIRQFVTQCFLTVIALSSCFFDGLLHLVLHDPTTNGKTYHTTMIIFLIDGMIIQTCNFLMIKECQDALVRWFKKFNILCPIMGEEEKLGEHSKGNVARSHSTGNTNTNSKKSSDNQSVVSGETRGVSDLSTDAGMKSHTKQNSLGDVELN